MHIFRLFCTLFFALNPLNLAAMQAALVSPRSAAQENPLFSAIKNYNLNAITWHLMLMQPISVNDKDRNGNTPLIVATLVCGNSKTTDQFNIATHIVDKLVYKGASVNTAGAGGNTALICGAFTGSEWVVEYLINRHADINQANNLGETALIIASASSKVAIVKLLLNAGANAHAHDLKGNTALSVATAPEIIQLLKDSSTEVDVSDLVGSISLEAISGRATPSLNNGSVGALPPSQETNRDANLILAAREGKADELQRLLHAGANVNTKIENTSLIEAAINGHTQVARILLQNGAHINDRDASHEENGHNTALIYAVGNQHIDIVRLLLEAGADIYAENRMQLNAVTVAAYMNNQSIVSLFKNKLGLVGYNKAIVQKIKPDDLVAVIEEGKSEVIRAYLDGGGSPNAKDSSGQPLLCEAISRKQEDIVKLLLDKGASVNVRDRDGDTPLHVAVLYSLTDTVAMLVDKGANVYAKDSKGETVIDTEPQIQKYGIF